MSIRWNRRRGRPRKRHLRSASSDRWGHEAHARHGGADARTGSPFSPPEPPRLTSSRSSHRSRRPTRTSSQSSRRRPRPRTPSRSSRRSRRPCRARTSRTRWARCSCRATRSRHRSGRRRSARTRSCRRSGSAPAPPTGFRGRCSHRSTRSSPTSAATWGRARPARSAGCSSCRTPGCAGAPTETATGSPIRGIPRTASSRPRAISPRPAGPRTSLVRSSPTTTPSGTWTRCSGWRRSSAVTSTLPSRSTSWRSGSRKPRRPLRRRARRCGRQSRDAAELQLRVTALDDRAAATDLLLSDRLDVEKEAFEVDQQNAAADAEVERLQAQLTTAEEVLEQARTGAHAASFNPAAAGILGGPSRADGYVFPVGGGPAFVSVGHTHHDYPAADIAAPEGSPVFALADSIVLDTVDDGRCGTGMHPPDTRRDPLALLPPLATRPRRAARSGALRRPVGRPRRLDRRRHRPAPPSGS